MASAISSSLLVLLSLNIIGHEMFSLVLHDNTVYVLAANEKIQYMFLNALVPGKETKSGLKPFLLLLLLLLLSVNIICSERFSLVLHGNGVYVCAANDKILYTFLEVPIPV